MTPRSGPARAIARLVTICATATVLVTAAGIPAGAAVTWTRVASPNPGTVASVLQDVAVVPGNPAPGTPTAWAVGYSYDNAVAAYRTMIQRYGNGSWSIVSSPNASTTGSSQLTKVDATDAANVWAIGSDSQAGTLVLRYNGSSWARMTAPSGISPRSIDVVSATDVWVAGYNGSAATVARWNHGTWTTVYTQATTGRHLTVFEGITVDATGRVWAVGWDRDYDAPGRPVSSLVVQFKNPTWTRETSPNPADRNTLMDVVALTNGDVVAVGVAQTVSGGGITPRSLMLRRGPSTGWADVKVPAAESGSQDQLSSVTAASSSDVWAVGYYSSPSTGLYDPLLVRATGTVATTHQEPALGMSATAWGVSATPGGTIWAVGYTSPPSGGNATLTLRGTGG
jgi:hypothetical protein